MHPAYAVQLFAMPCNGPLACPASCQLQLISVDGYCLPAWLDDEPVRPHGHGAAYSICRSTRFDVIVAPGHGHTAALCALSDRPTSLLQLLLQLLQLWLWAFSARAVQGREGRRRRSRMRRLVSPSPNLQLPAALAHRPPMHHPVPPDPQHLAIIRRPNSRTKPLLVFRRDAPPPGMQDLHEW